MPEGSGARAALGALGVATYTFFIALEFSRERCKSMRSRTAAIVVPFLHAAIFLLPLGMRGLMPEAIAVSWVTVFALETILYAVGTAFIVLLMVKDQPRSTSTGTRLDRLPDRPAQPARLLGECIAAVRATGKHGKPVTLLAFDLDHLSRSTIDSAMGSAMKCCAYSRRPRGAACAQATLSASWAAKNLRRSWPSRWNRAR